MTQKDIERMLNESGGLDTSHIKKDDILAKAKQEMYFGSAEIQEPKKEKDSFALLFTKKRFIPIAAGIALAFTLFSGMIGLYNENFQTVYIDINPSVALKLNRFERVIGVEYLNDDAKTLLSDTKLVGCDAKEALATVISTCNLAGYVNESSEIYISATSKQEKNAEELLTKLKCHAENMKEQEAETYSVSTYNAKKEKKENYEKSSLSPAKYDIIHEIIEDNEDYEIDDLRDKTMGELKKIKNDRDDDDDYNDDYNDDYKKEEEKHRDHENGKINDNVDRGDDEKHPRD